MQYFYSNQISENTIVLDEQESKHCTKVLRKGVGDEVDVIDGSGAIYHCSIAKSSKRIELDIKSKSQTDQKFKLFVAVAPTKSADRMEWMIEKLIEVGVAGVYFIQSDNSERSRMNPRRINLKAVSAMKQSGNVSMPELEFEMSFQDLIEHHRKEHNYLAHCYPDAQRQNLLDTGNAESLILIGPEGDFSRSELELAEKKGFEFISLGLPRYRTETAAVVACTVFNHLNVTEKV